MTYIRILCLFLLSQIAYCQTLQEVKKLYDTLFNDYRNNIVPVNNRSEPIEIDIRFYMMALNEFKETEETLIINCVFFITWKDVSMIWDPSNYGNMSYIHVDSKDLWLPLLYLVNTASKLEPVGSDTLFRANVFSNGQVRYAPGGTLKAKCSTDISKFPLDTQTCTLEFLNWDSSPLVGSYYKFTSPAKTINLGYFTVNAYWEITRTFAYPKLRSRGYYSYEVSLTIKRKPAYYIVMIILPTVMLCLLNPLVFLLPVESGERISLSVTILLSYAIFLTLVAQSIPAASDSMCVLLIIMTSIMIISGLTVVTVVMSGAYYYTETYTPGLVATFCIKLSKRKIVDRDEHETQCVTIFSGRDMSGMLDKLFLIISYMFIVVILGVYFVYILVL